MAFIYKAERKMGHVENELAKLTNIGPGAYDN